MQLSLMTHLYRLHFAHRGISHTEICFTIFRDWPNDVFYMKITFIQAVLETLEICFVPHMLQRIYISNEYYLQHINNWPMYIFLLLHILKQIIKDILKCMCDSGVGKMSSSSCPQVAQPTQVSQSRCA